MWGLSWRLQSRDPFSGDCDLHLPLPGLWGLPAPCRAETRSQGIATMPQPLEEPVQVDQPCRAETRSQGIATRWIPWPRSASGSGCLQSRDPFSGDCDSMTTRRASARRIRPSLAEPRPVLRGLRPYPSSRSTASQRRLAEPRPVLRGLRLHGLIPAHSRHPDLQSRDPFSGDCDPSQATHPAATGVNSLQSRDPFSGDCDVGALLHPGRAVDQPCRAETRSQGIATRVFPLCLPQCTTTACRAETRSQGIATNDTPRLHAGGLNSNLQSRDPFSGDCDRSHPRNQPHPDDRPCKAETRSQGIAT